jgi:plastocyanin
MDRRFGALAIVCASLTMPASAAAASKTVYAGGPVKFQNGSIRTKYRAGVDNFVINRVTVNVGDTVVWDGKALASGFHTVDLPGKDRPLPLFAPTGHLVSGVNDAAGNAFWFNKLPLLGFNPALFGRSGGKTYNGTEPVDSGLPLGKPKDLKVRFTKAGVYKYFCNVHPGMVGFVVVKNKGEQIPSAQQDAATLAKEEVRYTDIARHLDSTEVRGNDDVSVGASGPGGVEVFAMFPGKLTVRTGTSVTFAMSKRSRELHTASFGPTSYLGPLSQTFKGGPVPDAKALYASDSPGSITLSPTSHGNGFANTGAMDRDGSTALPASGKITFTAPGTYKFICLIHPFMHGTVVVTP